MYNSIHISRRSMIINVGAILQTILPAHAGDSEDSFKCGRNRVAALKLTTD